MSELSEGGRSPIRVQVLRSRDWEYRGTFANGAQVWGKGLAEVVFPSSPGVVDYSLRLRQAIEGVAEVEGVPAASIAEELAAGRGETAYWRLETGATPGQIDLNTLERSLNAIRRLHVYSAASYEARRSLFGKRITRRARSMAQRLDVGLTRQGSYILPVAAQTGRSTRERLLTQFVPEGDIPDFESGSLRLLARALGSLHRYLSLGEDLTPDSLLSVVNDGVSYELVVALMDLLRSVRIEYFDFVLVTDTTDEQSRSVRFVLGDVDLLDKLQDRLFGANITGAEIIIATVKEASRPERGDGAAPGGRVKLRRIGGSSRRSLLIADLDERAYQNALAAIGTRDQVELRARVVEEPGKIPRLEDVEYLHRRVQTEVDLDAV